ncbi:MAG: fatty acyl-AMP ligase [Haliangiales bacterium]
MYAPWLPSRPTSLIDVLRGYENPEAPKAGFDFLDAPGRQPATRSYADMARRSKAVGAGLQRMLDSGDRVLLLYPPGLGYIEAFWGCLFAGAIAVPAYPPLPNRPDQRLQALTVDAAPQVVLVPSALMSLRPMLQAAYPALAEIEWMASDLINDSLADAWSEPEVSGESIAFLQYTSGSTGVPRGVEVSHGNLLHNLAYIKDVFGLHGEDRGVFWLPPYHDMGLIGGILAPLYVGFSATLFSPLTFLQQPHMWLQTISELGATVSGAPNFAYDLCARKLTPAQRDALTLSPWRVAFNGAEPIRSATLARFLDVFGPRGFRPETFLPCYGLAEGTLLVTGSPHDERPETLTVDVEALRAHRVVPADDGERLISSGPPIAAVQDLRIVDPESCEPRGESELGEIWLGGDSIARGYWNRPEDSAATFSCHLADGTGPFLRTGDLGFLHGGQLYVTGRIKDLIIVDGRNHYPQDLEATIENTHPAIRPGRCAAFAVDGDAGEAVVAVVELQDTSAIEEAEQALRRAVQSQHDLGLSEVAWVRKGEIPKTSSGKLRRRECRNRFLAGELKRL